jgi:hypothetical protein
LASLLAAPVFVGPGIHRAIRIGLVLAGVLCLAGLLGVVTANMQIRNIGIIGYAIVFPAITPLMARAFGREDELATEFRSSALTPAASNGHRPPAASSR